MTVNENKMNEKETWRMDATPDDEGRTLRAGPDMPDSDDKTWRIEEPEADDDDFRTMRLDDDMEQPMEEASGQTMGRTAGQTMGRKKKKDLKTTSGRPPRADFFTTDIDTFNLNGKNYRVVETLSDTSGEAQIYLLEHEGNEYVLKLYYPNFTPKIELLEVIASLNSDFVVRLMDYGIMTQGNSSRTFEIMEYLRGGDLENYALNDDEPAFKRLSLAAATALHVCHVHGIIHKDVKLSNFFFRDEEQCELVLGDFGISSLMSEEDSVHQTTQARTPLYAAPEMYTNVINGVVELTPKVDFYSLGITLLYFFLGRNPFSGNERGMMHLKAEGKIPGLDRLPDYANKLIRGLTIVNPQHRWGYEEVVKWYKGEEVVIDETMALQYKKFIFDPDKKLIANNPQEMAALMKADRQAGIRYLYNKRVVRWLDDSGNQKLSSEIDEIVEKIFPLNQSAGFMAAIYTLDNQAPFLIDPEHPTSTPEEIVKAFHLGERTDDDYQALVDGRLLVWLASKNQPLLYDEVKLLTRNKTYTRGLAYGVLYHLDRTCGYDLGEYTDRKRVGDLMSKALIAAQDITDEGKYAKALEEFLSDKDRLYYYCTSHQWDDVLEYRAFCMNFDAQVTRERFGEYNIFVAAYKFCRGLGATPGYFFPASGKTAYTLKDIERIGSREVANEMRNRGLKYFITIFYHEDPFEKFAGDYSYEKTLVSYLEYVNKICNTEYYSKRFVTAKAEQIKQNNVFNRKFRSVIYGDLTGFLTMSVLSALFLYLLNTHKITNPEQFVHVYLLGVCAPLALFGLITFTIKAFFMSPGVILSVFIMLGGVILNLIPAAAGYWWITNHPDQIMLTLNGLSFFYLLIFFTSWVKKTSLKVRKLKPLLNSTLESTLIDPLYFTYKSTASKYLGTNTKAMEDAIDVVEIARRKLVQLYSIWIFLVLMFLAIYTYFCPELIGGKIPDINMEVIENLLKTEPNT